MINLKYLLFGAFLLLVVTQMQGCVTQQAPREILNSEKILRCIKRLGESRSLTKRHEICSKIFEAKE